MSTDLTLGSRGPEVGNWQRFLNEQGCRDQDDRVLVNDEIFGPRSTAATRRWQTDSELAVTGVVRTIDRRSAQKQGFIPFVQAKNFGPILYPKSTRPLDLIVIHTMENDEKPTDAAENVALWFAGRTRYVAPRASCHYCVDRDSVIQCVRDVDVAWHAPGANHNGIGIEHAGRARQSVDDWADEASLRILDTSARLTAKLADRYEIPVMKIAPDEIRAGVRGFVGHFDVTLAYPGPGRTHWDPGSSFPWTYYLSLVASLMKG